MAKAEGTALDAGGLVASSLAVGHGFLVRRPASGQILTVWGFWAGSLSPSGCGLDWLVPSPGPKAGPETVRKSRRGG